MDDVAAFVAMGSNLGDRLGHLKAALKELERRLGPALCSPAYETLPVEIVEQPQYLNAVCKLQTGMAPRDLLDILLSIEASRGRIRTTRYGPRVLDLDLVLYGDLVIDEPGLAVPHPRMRERAFVLVPLVDIAPQVVDPVSGLTASELLGKLRRPLGIKNMVELR